MTVDDLHYISFPCPCAEDLAGDPGIQSTTATITLFNVVIITIRASALNTLQLKYPDTFSRTDVPKRSILNEISQTMIATAHSEYGSSRGRSQCGRDDAVHEIRQPTNTKVLRR